MITNVAEFSRQHLKDLVWLRVAFEVSRLGTCPRRTVGCVLLDASGRVLSTGHNGGLPGAPHCIDVPCPGAEAKSGEGLDECDAIHAEQNAMIYCPFPSQIHTVYCTDSPCSSCVKLLLTAPAQRLVFARAYPHPYARSRWEDAGRKWDHVPVEPPSWNNTEGQIRGRSDV